MDLTQAAAAIYDIGAASGKNRKEELLRMHEHVPGFKESLHFIFNPYIKTNLAKKKMDKDTAVSRPRHTIGIEEAVAYFATHQTGTQNDVCFAHRFIKSQPSAIAKLLAMAIVTQSLTIGVTETTLNKVYGDEFIPKLGIMLAEKYFEKKDKVKGPFIVTEKLDGHRRIMVKENGQVSFFTRSGLPDEGLIEVEAEAQCLPDNAVYDGEFLAIGEFSDSIELRIATSAIMSKDGTRRSVTFNVFDWVDLKDFKKGTSLPAFARKISLGALFKDISIHHLISKPEMYIETFGIKYDFKFIKYVPILGVVSTEDEVMALTQPIWDRAFEGTMLNTINGLYETKRTKELLKVKHTKEHKLPIVQCLEGEGKFAGTLGSFVVDYKGHNVGVGSGLSSAQRDKFWAARKDLIGVVVEIDSFGETKDKRGSFSLNCPIFKRIVGDTSAV